ncbi:rCG34257 [Rattus norvegicus]|uniref:RCG34257 n=1 Tax=Rattus norvegicus TaxID=10116 RepID=A6HKK3_RAT|nr:rCG34257 [Rattus norvegicus]
MSLLATELKIQPQDTSWTSETDIKRHTKFVLFFDMLHSVGVQ